MFRRGGQPRAVELARQPAGPTRKGLPGSDEPRGVTDDRLDANRAHWDELAEHHPKTEFYDVEAFLEGDSSLDAVE